MIVQNSDLLSGLVLESIILDVDNELYSPLPPLEDGNLIVVDGPEDKLDVDDEQLSNEEIVELLSDARAEVQELEEDVVDGEVIPPL